MSRVGRSVTALCSFAVAGLVFTGAFTGTWASGVDVVPSAAAAERGDGEPFDRETHGGCDGSCEASAKVCVKKCVVDQKPCLDRCKINEDDNPKNLKPKDQACAKACLDRSRPCQERCQGRRATCVRGCSH